MYDDDAALDAFEDLLNDIETTLIPIEYVMSIEIIYKDESSVTLSGDDLLHNQDFNGRRSWNQLQKSTEDIETVKVRINTVLLKEEIDYELNYIFGSNRI